MRRSRRALVVLLAVAAAVAAVTARSATTGSPIIDAHPTISGDLSVGSTLTANENVVSVMDDQGLVPPDQWSIVSLHWVRCKADGTWCAQIQPGEASAPTTYTLQPDDAGCAIKFGYAVIARGKNAGSPISPPVGPIAPARPCIRDWQVNPGPPPPPAPPPAPPPPPVTPLTVVTDSLEVATLRITYSVLLFNGGRQPYTIAVTAGVLPPGLGFRDYGLLTGIPTQEGTFTFTIQATDVDGRTISGTFTVPVHPQRDFGGTTLPKGPPLLLPSPALTPGVRNPAVRQATVGATICNRRWLVRARPKPAALEGLKLVQLRQYGDASPPTRYVEDHLIPIDLGGHPTSRWNVWPEPRYQARASAALEVGLNRKVCSGRISLAAAQRLIVRFKRANG